MKVRKEKKWIEKENPASADTAFLDPPRWRSLATLGGEHRLTEIKTRERSRWQVQEATCPLPGALDPKAACPPLLCTHTSHAQAARPHTAFPQETPGKTARMNPVCRKPPRNASRCLSLCPAHTLTNHRNKVWGSSAWVTFSPPAARQAQLPVKALGLMRARWAGCREGALSYFWLHRASWLLLPPRCLDRSMRLPWTAQWNCWGSCDGQISAPSLRLGAHRVA